jgi:hypothetical protein
LVLGNKYEISGKPLTHLWKWAEEETGIDFYKRSGK